ncbi:MAG TPA: VOC family protein [Candidatus Woesebacteria bacterium]|nr:VOC family protein [Candidatus Woesebacteria bacterium]
MNKGFTIALISIFIIVGIMINDMLHEQFLLKNKTDATTLLSKSLDMGATELNVKDMELMEQYYTEYVGLEILAKTGETVILGHKDRQIIILNASQEPKSVLGSAGLYHNAIVYASRGQLARTVKKILNETPQYYLGTADHLVSEAFYFTDPEGNGLELYFDKDKSTWEWQEGKIKMDSIYIDPIAYIEKYSSEYESTDKHMGHVHLKVGNIENAKKFYVDILGFDITAEMDSALFVSVAGYHHHVGMNTWESKNAGKRVPSLGLKSITLILNSKADVALLKERLKRNTIIFDEDIHEILFLDPWNNQIKVKTQELL